VHSAGDKTRKGRARKGQFTGSLKVRSGIGALLKQKERTLAAPDKGASLVTTKGEYMELLWTLLIGLVVGIVAKFLMPGRDPGGFIVTALLGVAGAFVAHAIGRAMGWYATGEPAGFIASVFGAIILLAIYRMVIGRRVRA
jgi:uncharacterized membrane protein YeaQ/YmgE (transglycosylase-associated protein family)